jgi:Family of unknown function (DUF6166)
LRRSSRPNYLRNWLSGTTVCFLIAFFGGALILMPPRFRPIATRADHEVDLIGISSVLASANAQMLALILTGALVVVQTTSRFGSSIALKQLGPRVASFTGAYLLLGVLVPLFGPNLSVPHVEGICTLSAAIAMASNIPLIQYLASRMSPIGPLEAYAARIAKLLKKGVAAELGLEGHVKRFRSRSHITLTEFVGPEDNDIRRLEETLAELSTFYEDIPATERDWQRALGILEDVIIAVASHSSPRVSHLADSLPPLLAVHGVSNPTSRIIRPIIESLGRISVKCTENEARSSCVDQVLALARTLQMPARGPDDANWATLFQALSRATVAALAERTRFDFLEGKHNLFGRAEHPDSLAVDIYERCVLTLADLLSSAIEEQPRHVDSFITMFARFNLTLHAARRIPPNLLVERQLVAWALGQIQEDLPTHSNPLGIGSISLAPQQAAERVTALASCVRNLMVLGTRSVEMHLDDAAAETWKRLVEILSVAAETKNEPAWSQAIDSISQASHDIRIRDKAPAADRRRAILTISHLATALAAAVPAVIEWGQPSVVGSLKSLYWSLGERWAMDNAMVQLSVGKSVLSGVAEWDENWCPTVEELKARAAGRFNSWYTTSVSDSSSPALALIDLFFAWQVGPLIPRLFHELALWRQEARRFAHEPQQTAEALRTAELLSESRRSARLDIKREWSFPSSRLAAYRTAHHRWVGRPELRVFGEDITVAPAGADQSTLSVLVLARELIECLDQEDDTKRSGLEAMERSYFGSASDRRYYGVQDNFGPCVIVEEADGSVRYLLDDDRHSHSAFTWGYIGTGPFELAMAMLRDALGVASTCPYCLSTCHGAPTEPSWCVQCSNSGQRPELEELAAMYRDQTTSVWEERELNPSWAVTRHEILAWVYSQISS